MRKLDFLVGNNLIANAFNTKYLKKQIKKLDNCLKLKEKIMNNFQRNKKNNQKFKMKRFKFKILNKQT